MYCVLLLDHVVVRCEGDLETIITVVRDKEEKWEDHAEVGTGNGKIEWNRRI